MTEQTEKEKKDLDFRKMADSFIDVANKHCDTTDAAQVGSALLYASSRFSSFVVASYANNKEAYETEIDNAVEYFSVEFKKMLLENLNQYKSIFDEAPRYEHLIKNSPENKV